MSYRWWGRPGYEHFYYFSTPLWRWWKFKGRLWPAMPRSMERRVLRVLDVYLHYSGYRERYRRRKLGSLRQLRRERRDLRSSAKELVEAMADNLRSIGTPAHAARREELERSRQAWAARLAEREATKHATPEEAAETERMLLEWLRNKPHAPATEADRKKGARDLLDINKGPPIELPEHGTKQ